MLAHRQGTSAVRSGREGASRTFKLAPPLIASRSSTEKRPSPQTSGIWFGQGVSARARSNSASLSAQNPLPRVSSTNRAGGGADREGRMGAGASRACEGLGTRPLEETVPQVRAPERSDAGVSTIGGLSALVAIKTGDRGSDSDAQPAIPRAPDGVRQDGEQEEIFLTGVDCARR